VVLALWDAFKAEGISIPFPQRELRLLNDRVAVQMAEGQSTPEDADDLGSQSRGGAAQLD